jgi:hypothetical protein
MFPASLARAGDLCGEGLRKLLASGEDLQEAAVLNANWLLSRRPATAAELRLAAQRLLTFAVDPLAMA